GKTSPPLAPLATPAGRRGGYPPACCNTITTSRHRRRLNLLMPRPKALLTRARCATNTGPSNLPASRADRIRRTAVTNKQPVPDAILELGLPFWGSKALLSAVGLDLFTTLGHGPRTAVPLTAKLRRRHPGPA